MLGAVIIFVLLPSFISCSGDGNIRILEDEIANALQTCVDVDKDGIQNQRQRRSNDDHYVDKPLIDDNLKTEPNQYGHEKRNTDNTSSHVNVSNTTENDYKRYGIEDTRTQIFTSVLSNDTSMNLNRKRRDNRLLNKVDPDQVF